MKSLLKLTLLAVLMVTACKKDEPAATPAAPKAVKPSVPAAQAADPNGWEAKALAGKDIYAVMKTNLGDITLRLFSKDAPKTVANFVGLASGERQWKNPATGEMKTNTPLYNGTIFHRVIEGFMIQGGDPLGVGMGGPGYKFEDEFQSGRTFDKPGILAMANSGANTNGSQFFITTSVPSHLNNRHTIFGEVIKGYEVVQTIERVPKGPMDKPVQPVSIQSIQLSENAQ